MTIFSLKRELLKKESSLILRHFSPQTRTECKCLPKVPESFANLSYMSKKTSEKLDVGSEDFEKILDFLKEDSEAPPASATEQAEFTALKTLLLTPAQNRRAVKGYLQQTSSLQKGDRVKKAA
jgi:hypothetical protein